VDSVVLEQEFRYNQEHQAMLDAAALAAQLDPHFDAMDQLNPRYWRPNATRISARRKRNVSNLDVTKVTGRTPTPSKGDEMMTELEPEPEEAPPVAVVVGDMVDPSNSDEVLRVSHLLEKSNEKRFLLKVRSKSPSNCITDY